MGRLRTIWRHAAAATLCLSLVLWSVMPAASHAPTVFETIHDHLEMIADHGHSHGFGEDLYWAMHGHSHDAADHDHSKVILVHDGGRGTIAGYRQERRLPATSGFSGPVFRIERPPRA